MEAADALQSVDDSWETSLEIALQLLTHHQIDNEEVHWPVYSMPRGVSNYCAGPQNLSTELAADPGTRYGRRRSRVQTLSTHAHK